MQMVLVPIKDSVLRVENENILPDGRLLLG